MRCIELEQPTLSGIIESAYFRSQLGKIRDRTFEDLKAYSSYQRIREYGFTVEASREGIFVGDVVKGRTRSMVPHAIFNRGEGVILVDVHSHKILGGHYALPPSWNDFEYWQFLEQWNKGAQSKNRALKNYVGRPVGAVVFFYDEEQVGMNLTRVPLDLEVDSFRRELSTLMVEAGVTNKDFRTEVGVGCQVAACDLLFPSAFYKSSIHRLKLPKNVERKFPILKTL